MLIIPLNLDSVLLLLHNSKLAYSSCTSRCASLVDNPKARAYLPTSPKAQGSA